MYFPIFSLIVHTQVGLNTGSLILRDEKNWAGMDPVWNQQTAVK